MLFNKIKRFFNSFFLFGAGESSVKLKSIVISLRAKTVKQKRDTYLGGLEDHRELELA